MLMRPRPKPIVEVGGVVDGTLSNAWMAGGDGDGERSTESIPLCLPVSVQPGNGDIVEVPLGADTTAKDVVDFCTKGETDSWWILVADLNGQCSPDATVEGKYPCGDGGTLKSFRDLIAPATMPMFTTAPMFARCNPAFGALQPRAYGSTMAAVASPFVNRYRV
uniref:Uncharacterized protein n=1 Tax=Plectus sambesii TaxID=2011161 RepID=A0A914V7X4_9BILA